MFTILGAYASEALTFWGKTNGFYISLCMDFKFYMEREKKYNVQDAVVNSYFYVDRD